MEDTYEKAYSPKEISTTLDIGDSSLRKWCIALEKNGYGFIRNDHKQRVFVENDLVVLRHFQNLVKHHNMQLENAAKLVIDRFGKGAFEVSTGGVPAVREEENLDLQRDFVRSSEETLEALLEHIKTQDEFNKTLLNRLDQQQKYFEERFEKMEHDRELMESIRRKQEEKHEQVLLQIAADQEEQKKKKGFFARVFGK